LPVRWSERRRLNPDRVRFVTQRSHHAALFL
jgi:hypothetical protein